MMSDRLRWVKLLLALALTIGVGWKYAVDSATVWAVYPRAMRGGQDGRELRFPIWEVVAIDGPERYRISKVVQDIPIEGDTRDLKVGDTVSVIGRLRAADGVVIAEITEVHHLRKVKTALSLLGVVLAIAAFPVGFRREGRRLIERA